jgi:DNA repair exonuclease SbcCD ATPase subunit
MGEVIQSLRRRERLDGPDIAYLWARSMLEAARAGLHPPAIWVTYDQLLAAPSKVLERAGTAFGVAFDVPMRTEFIDTSLRHHADAPTDDVPRELAAFCEELYGAIRKAAETGRGLGVARFRQHDAALAALDRMLLPDMMQQRYFEIRRVHEGLLRENDAARVTVERQASELAAARLNIADLVNQLEKARETIGALVAQIDEARRSHAARDSAEAELRKRLDALLAEIEAARVTIERQATELDAARSTIEGLVAERDNARHVIERKERELGDASRSIDELTEQIASARATIETRAGEIDAARTTINDLVVELDAARAVIEGRVAEVDAARTTIDNLLRQIEDARQAHAERDRIERELRDSIARLDAAAQATQGREV